MAACLSLRSWRFRSTWLLLSDHHRSAANVRPRIRDFQLAKPVPVARGTIAVGLFKVGVKGKVQGMEGKGRTGPLAETLIRVDDTSRR